MFAEEMLGPSIALEPPDTAVLEVAAPVSGVLSVYKPHAFIVTPRGGPAVLVHLGIDTVKAPELFKRAAGTPAAGEVVEEGQPLTEWNVEATRQQGLSTMVPIVLLDAPVATKLELLGDLSPVEGVVELGDPIARVTEP